MSKKRPGIRIDVEVEVLKDERYEALGEIAGYNRHEALGRMYALWAWCLERQDFVVHDAVIRRFLGARGVDAILANGIDDLALGSRVDDRIYVRGTHRLAWLGARRSAASKGGRARAECKRDDNGKYVSEHTNSPATLQPEPTQTTHLASQLPANVQPSDPDVEEKSVRTAQEGSPIYSGLLNLQSVTDKAAESARRAQLKRNRIPDRAWRAADHMRGLVLHKYPSCALAGKANRWTDSGERGKWADSLRLMVDQDRRTWEQLAEMLDWVFHKQSGGQFDFIVQSPTALREKWDAISANRAKSSPAQIRTYKPTRPADYDDSTTVNPMFAAMLAAESEAQK